jgi:uncharacterized protein (DUF2147 family)
MKTPSKILLLLLLASSTVFAQTAPADGILGTWFTANQTSEIAIVKCGDAYCGTIQSLKTPKNDEKNPDPSLRSRPLVGVQVLTNFHYTDANTWIGGTLYGPERGKEFPATLVLASPDSLDIKVKAGMMSKTITWTREK